MKNYDMTEVTVEGKWVVDDVIGAISDWFTEVKERLYYINLDPSLVDTGMKLKVYVEDLPEYGFSAIQDYLWSLTDEHFEFMDSLEEYDNGVYDRENEHQRNVVFDRELAESLRYKNGKLTVSIGFKFSTDDQFEIERVRDSL